MGIRREGFEDGLGKVKVEVRGVGCRMGELGFFSKEGEEGVVEEGLVEVCEFGLVGFCCCGDEGVSEVAWRFYFWG